MSRNRPPKFFISIPCFMCVGYYQNTCTFLLSCEKFPLLFRYQPKKWGDIRLKFCVFAENPCLISCFSDFNAVTGSHEGHYLVELNRLSFCADGRSFKKVWLLKVPLLLTNRQRLKMLIPWFKIGSTDLMFLPQIRKALMGVDQPDLLWSTRLHLSLLLSGNRDVLSQSGPAT